MRARKVGLHYVSVSGKAVVHEMHSWNWGRALMPDCAPCSREAKMRAGRKLLRQLHVGKKPGVGEARGEGASCWEDIMTSCRS